MSKILDCYWGKGFGVVIVFDDYDGIKAYAKDISGMDEQVDKQNIADYGNTFPMSAALELMPRVKEMMEK